MSSRTSSSLRLALNGKKLVGFEDILFKRKRVKSEEEFRAWEVEYHTWRWSNSLLGQFQPREVKFSLALPGALELVLESPRFRLLTNEIEIDHRFEERSIMSTRFADVPWLVTHAKLMTGLCCANPLPQGYVMSYMRQSDATVFVLREAEGDDGKRSFDHQIVIEAAIGRENGPGGAKTARDYYAALSAALHEVLCMSIPKPAPFPPV